LFAALGWRQLYASPPGFGEADGNRLFWRASAVFALPNVFYFFAHEFPGLCGRRFALAFVFARPFYCVFFWQYPKIVSLPRGHSDVTKN
jgi:hypothetical protein